MERNRRVALIVPHLGNSLDNDLVGGVFSYGEKYGFDTVVLTGIFNAKINHFSHSYSKSINNIYSLLKNGDFDGVIFAAGRFSSDSTREKIFRMLRERDLPCVVVDYHCNDFDCILPPQREYMKLMTQHLINVHGLRNLYCITGIPDDDTSAERLAGFTDALDEAGIECSDSSVHYGYFCREIPRQIGYDIADGTIPVPEGIVCTDDIMAAGICSAFEERGIKVPEDIAVVGYEGSVEACINGTSLTTGAGHEFTMGMEAMKRLAELLGVNDTVPVADIKHIYIGTTCGCEHNESLRDMYGIGSSCCKKHQMMKYAERKKLILSDIAGTIAGCENIEQIVDVSNRLGYLLLNWDKVCIGLCDDWMFDFDEPESFRREDLSENMTYYISRRNKKTDSSIFTVPSASVIPNANLSDKPCIYVLNSLYYQRQIFGYVCTTYISPDDICLDEFYNCWRDSLCTQLHIMQEKLYRVHMSSKVENLSMIDPLTGMYNKRGLIEKFPGFIAAAGGDRFIIFILAYSEAQSGSYDVSPVSIVANVLCDFEKDSIISVPEDNIIVCIRRASKENDTETASKHFLESVKILIKNFYNGAAKINMDRLAMICKFFEDTNIVSFAEMLDELIDNAKMKALSVSVQPDDCREQLHKIRGKFLENPQQDWTIDSISKEIGISKSHLQRLYKDEFGSSCIDDIISARLDRAKWLLVNTDMKIGRIAEQCGYLNESHFMRQFKTRTGMTALKFRKDHQNSVLAGKT